MDTPLSETTNSLKLEEIKRRCAELNDQPLELTLVDAEEIFDGSDPYNRSSV